MLKSKLWLLLPALLPALLCACALPLNTAVRDWSRTAGMAVAPPGIAAAEAPDADRAMQQALATYFYALGVLWDGAELPFDEARFAALAPRVADTAASQAVVELGGLLRAASDEKPPRWLPRDNSSATPAYEDRRLSRTIRAADSSVQLLLIALSRSASPAGAPPPPAPSRTAASGMEASGMEASDPALRQAILEREEHQARRAAERRAARAQYAAALTRIAEGHAVMAARAGEITQRSTELQLRVAEDRLLRVMNDRRPPPPDPGAATGP